MARVIIDKAALEAGEPAIQVVTDSGTRFNVYALTIHGDARIVQYDKPQQDGTRIEIQTEDWHA